MARGSVSLSGGLLKTCWMSELRHGARIAFRRLHGLALDTEAGDDRAPCPDEQFFRYAGQHRITGLLAADWVPAWRSYACGQALYTARCSAAAERLFGALQDTLPALALIKGPALAVQAWPQPGLRHYDDLDFRCAFIRYARLRDALSGLGYRPDGEDERRQAHLWHFGWGTAFVHADGPRLEFNHRMFPPHYPWPAGLNPGRGGEWMRLQLDQHAIVAPSPALHLLICCMHAVWHGWERLAWVADIAGLLATYPEAYTQAHALAGGAQFPRRAITTATALANRIFGPLPGADAFYPAPARAIQDAWQACAQAPTGRGFAAQRRLHKAFLNWPGCLGYDLRRLLTPGDADFRCWPLPAAIPGAYWLLRPLRLLVCRRTVGRSRADRRP